MLYVIVSKRGWCKYYSSPPEVQSVGLCLRGWPEDGLTPAEAAAREAGEEAGVTGKVKQRPIGVYSYEKHMENAESLPCIVTVYALKVKKLRDSYAEQSERRRKWFSCEEAASQVAEPELARLIKAFVP